MIDDWLKQAIAKAGTMKALSEKTGISYRTMQGWINKGREPGVYFIYHIADVMDMQPPGAATTENDIFLDAMLALEEFLIEEKMTISDPAAKVAIVKALAEAAQQDTRAGAEVIDFDKYKAFVRAAAR